MHPILFHIGSFELASYGLMTALAYLISSWYLYKRLHSIELDKDTFWNIIFIAFVSALLGSKLLYLILSWPDLGTTFADRLKNAIQGFRYGFVFFGGAIAAVGTLLYYLKKKKLPVLQTADFYIVALPLGHAIGRIGCFLAGCCHGKPTDLPWGVAFTNPHSLVAHEYLGVHLHPTQLYEVVLNLILFFILQRLYKKPHKNGTILIAYLLGYACLRFGVEFFRGDYRGGFFWGLSPSQLISLGTAVCALIALYFLKKGASHAH
ncbi:MAG: prolipoprotein diacylglyceryl transferase [Elusimicrobiaceae bacterium]|nr:prolipoprotein diacylglyceryl transferase [Elusimicrobiaceae bacterium]